MRTTTKVALVVVAAVGGLGLAALPDAEDNDTDPTLTAREAACQMLNDGDTAVEAFDVLVDLDVSELDASRAVNEAMADGCGSGD
jgi:hypothetical protein